MELKQILSEDCTRCAFTDTSKKKLLEAISELAATKLAGVSSADVFDSLLQRERLGSTGIGLGIAIPHGRLEKAGQPVAVLFTLKQPVDFDSIDNQPVDIIFALLVPESEPEMHLKTLSEVAEKFNDRVCCKALRSASSDKELYKAFTEQEQPCS